MKIGQYGVVSHGCAPRTALVGSFQLSMTGVNSSRELKTVAAVSTV